MMAAEAASILIPAVILIAYYGFIRRRIYPEDYK
jgi:hypothetical protein